MQGRFHLSIEDIKAIALAVLRHRIILNFDAHAEGKTADAILNGIIAALDARNPSS
jgi:MoxR-like ATPase